VLALVKEERSMLSTITRRKKNWIGHILRGQSLSKDVMEGGWRVNGQGEEGELGFI